LENLIERLILLSDGNEITISDLPEAMRGDVLSDELLRIVQWQAWPNLGYLATENVQLTEVIALDAV
jgi:hypothetical protein